MLVNVDTFDTDKILLDKLDTIIAEYEATTGVTVGVVMKFMHPCHNNMYRWNGMFERESVVDTMHIEGGSLTIVEPDTTVVQPVNPGSGVG